MSSSRIFKDHIDLPKFNASLTPVDRVDVVAEQRLKTEAEIAILKKAAYSEGQALGYRDGFDQGQAQGIIEGRTKGYDDAKQEFEAEHGEILADLRTSLITLLADFHKAVEIWFTGAEEQYASLAVEVARRAVAAELKLTNDSVIAIAREVLQNVRSGQEVKVRVNPGDVSILEAHRQNLLDAVAGIGGIEVVADRSIRAGVVIETSEGMIDARVETFLERFDALEAA